MAAVKELGYRPNPAAQALVKGTTSAIAVVARNTDRFGYAQTLQGISETAREAGYAVTITVVDSEEPEAVQRGLDLVLSQPVAGAVVIEFDDVGVATGKAFRGVVPVVAAAGAPHEVKTPHAFLDDSEGGRLATEYLLSLGHETVHHVAIPTTREGVGREWGWRQALADAGIVPVEPLRADYASISGYRIGLEMDLTGVTAILAGNDEVAIGVMRALQERWVRIPDDVSVMGFDDQPFAAMWKPSLSAVHQDFVDLGRRAFGLLNEWMTTGELPQDSIVVPTLELRESTAAPR